MDSLPIQLLGTTYAMFPVLWLATHLLVSALIPVVVYGFKRRGQFSRKEWSIGLSFVGVLIAMAAIDLRNSWSTIGDFTTFWVRHCYISVPSFFAASVIFTVLTLRVWAKIQVGLTPKSLRDRLERFVLCVASITSVVVVLGGFFGAGGGESGFAFGAIMALVPGVVFGLGTGITFATAQKPSQVFFMMGVLFLMIVAVQLIWSPVSYLPAKFKSDSGLVFSFDEGNTRHLVARGNQEFIVELDDLPKDLHVVGDLAIFNLYSEVNGGEVYAYNLDKRELEWEFNAAREVPTIPETSYTGISVDRSRVLVSVDQTIFALGLGNGEVLWKTPLPRQKIRAWDLPWTKCGRVGNALIFKCYEDLFCLDVKSGKLMWSIDCDPLERQPGMIASNSFGPAKRQQPSVVVVTSDDTSPSGYSLSFTSRRMIRSDEEVWSSLKPPPQTTHGAAEDALALHIFNSFWGSPQYICVLDLSVPISENGKANIKFSMIDKVELWKGNRLLIAAEPPMYLSGFND